MRYATLIKLGKESKKALKREPVNKDDLMSEDEIRWRAMRGCPEYILAELNACSVSTIQKILYGESKSKKPVKKWIVVNADDGNFYPSIAEAERQEGINKNCLSHYLRLHGTRLVYQGKHYHFYQYEDKSPKRMIVVNADDGIIYPSIYEAERQEGINRDCLSHYFKRHGRRINYKGTNFHLYHIKERTLKK